MAQIQNNHILKHSRLISAEQDILEQCITWFVLEVELVSVDEVIMFEDPLETMTIGCLVVVEAGLVPRILCPPAGRVS